MFAKRSLSDNTERYQVALFSFQSTGATNIVTVHSVLNRKAYIQKKVRGSNGNYHHCILEDNLACMIYLATYGAVNKTDADIKIYIMHYCCRKYYHSVNIHTDAATFIKSYSFTMNAVLVTLIKIGLLLYKNG